MKQGAAASHTFRGEPVDLVVDVRSKLEYWMGHLSGAVCLPGDKLLEALEERADINRHSRILLYCASGARSASVAEQLRTAGYSNVVDGGGMAAAYRHFRP